ncbi:MULTISPECIES: ABC transporter substrate-binding protein [unclassified Arthrobacter]|uniref:ABC transporter substrate-binding protein n=1 Tax=unclassified Arthrobacter TaxID=235627 RepID=UPI001C861C22|nr:ABC transporter substrate-binding protein [Arthrobacter sp. MAHUQ-56]MBX7445965.1 hypothetical protein [Arthrobacter sp. MAHUQ-56]
MSFLTTRRQFATAAVAAGAALAMGLSGCAGGSNGASTSASKVLTVAASAGPTSLDPMLQSVDQINNMYINLTYDSLTRIDGKGNVVPDLATKWEYTDPTTLTVTLRDGVKFSDGSPLTAQTVAKSLDYGRTKGVNGPNWLGSIASVTAADDKTVLIKTKEPNDALPSLLSQRMLLGSVISDKGLADPQALKSGSYGAGAYMLDTASTVANDTYTFVPNKNYWDQGKIKWDKIVIKVVGNAAAALQAVQSGSADLFSADAPTATAAKAAGLAVATAPFGLTGIEYNDRDGVLVPALKDPRVRQALNYAIDRKSIADAVYKDLSIPGTTPVQKGFPGYNEEDNSAYAYDMDKAKQLLAEAGYANGFSFNMSSPTANNTNLMAQAVIQSWAKLGVNANLTTYTDLGQLTTDILAKKYPVSAFNYGALPTYVQSKSFFTGGATQFNAFNTSNDQITQALVEASQATTEDARDAAYRKAWHTAVIDQAWLTNVYTRFQPTVYNDKKITGVDISTQNPVVDLAWTVTPVTK